jgi:hypothetical protein
MSASVYVIREQDSDRPVKIGWAIKPKSRLVHLQIGNPRKLAIAHLRECSCEEEARGVERTCHAKFNSSRLSGEWFDVSVAAAIQTLIAAEPTYPAPRNYVGTIERDLVEKIERHLAKSGQPHWLFGRLALNDTQLYLQLLQGRELRRATRAKIEKYIENYRQVAA